MENYLKNPIRKLFSNGASSLFLSIFLLISIAVFLVLPKISLADDFENITLKEIEKYLSIPANAVENLIRSLINLFNSEWMDRISSAYSTAEESAVPNIMRGAVRVQALNHLLIDAPINITFGIVKNGVKIAKIFLTQDVSTLLEELEKESVQRAVGYGRKVLLQNEIRITPGAIEFKYLNRKGETKTTIFQFVVIYQPIEAKKGKLVIRFYSPNYLEPPRDEGSVGMTWGTYTELTNDLPPFIVDVQGLAENYKWVGQPSMKIEFPPEVPDLGIKPLTFWERHVLKPIESTIKDIEVIITKVTGISPKIVEKILKIPQIAKDIYREIKSKINLFGPATLVETPAVPPAGVEKPPVEVGQEVPPGTKVETLKTKPQTEPESELRPRPLSDLEKMQEELDDIAERIDIMTQEMTKLVKEKNVKEEEEKEEEIEEEILEEDKKEKEDDDCFKSININTASKKELQKIIGVGLVIAQRIIDARPFSSIYDLIKVSGIGEMTLQKIIDQDCAYVDEFYSGYGGSGGSSDSSSDADVVPSPQITLSYPEENPVSQEIQVTLSASNLKNTTYDVKVSIESGTTTLSEIFNEKENKWQNSYNYLTEVFSGTPFSGDFKLKMKEAENSFRGEADIIVRVRESGKTNYSEFIDKINITEPEPEPEQPEQPQLLQTIVINEIAWMGTKANPADEWIELYNNGEEPINLLNWQLIFYPPDEEGPKITKFTLTDTTTPAIDGFGYFLLERTDDEPVDIKADYIFKGALNDPGGIFELRDNQGNLIDRVDCKKDENGKCIDWFAGKKEERVSMERVNPQESGTDPENWLNNNQIIINGRDADQNPIFGTPKAKNSVSYQPPITLPPHIDRDITLTTFYSPYIVQGHTTVWQNATLTIEPGVVLKFAPKTGNTDSQLQVLGTLKAIGTPEEKIIFTSYLDDLNDLELENLKDIEKDTNQDENSTVPYPGVWKWILFGGPEPNINPTSNSELSNVLIRYGDADDVGVIKVEKGSSIIIKDSLLEKNKRGIWLVSSPNTIIDGVEFISNNFLAVEIQNGGSPVVKNSRFEGKEGDQIGIFVGGGTAPRIENNFFTKNRTPILVETGSAALLKGNSGQNNELNGIIMSPSGRPYPEGINSIAWNFNEDFPYIIEASFTIGLDITLEIDPGTVIKFGRFHSSLGFIKDAYLNIQGGLTARGIEDKPIIFTSLRDDDYGGDTNNDGNSSLPQPGDWKELKVLGITDLDGVIVRYGGYDTGKSIIVDGLEGLIEEGKVEVEFEWQQP